MKMNQGKKRNETIRKKDKEIKKKKQKKVMLKNCRKL